MEGTLGESGLVFICHKTLFFAAFAAITGKKRRSFCSLNGAKTG
jgi:hypothetical protein